MIREIDGDLLEQDVDIIVHQTNCVAVMGGGVALQIRRKYPYVFREYKKFCQSSKKTDLLGTCQIVPVSIGARKYVANVFGQKGIGYGKQTDYQALESGLYELKEYAKENHLSVGIPHGIGCGLAGGDWNIVKGIIERVFNDYEVLIVKLEVRKKTWWT